MSNGMIERPAPRDTNIPTVQKPTDKDTWLTSIYVTQERNLVGSMSVQDYIHTTAGTDPTLSYWQDPHISWALEMLRRKHNSYEDVLMLSPLEASRLYAIATITGYLVTPDTQEFQEAFKPLYDQLNSRPIIVLPVNNGFITHDTIKRPTENQAGKDKPQRQKGYRANLGQGGHWSFIVLDRRDATRPTASYVDGMVRATKPGKTNGWKITNTRICGPVAGKTLCGFDALLGLEKGDFDARTMKFIPNMSSNENRRLADHGVCGPHMYAFLDHLLTRKA
jgi:hypothetical protein